MFIPPQTTPHNFHTNHRYPTVPGFAKLYVGQLPLNTQEKEIADAFSNYCGLGRIEIIRSNKKGGFMKYLYAFVSVKAQSEQQCFQIIKKVQENHHNWIVNINSLDDKSADRFKNQEKGPQNESIYIKTKTDKVQQNEFKEFNRSGFQIKGGEKPSESRPEKAHRIMVRELWMGGISESLTEESVHVIMQQFGTLEKIELFSKFCFVRYRMAEDATRAYEKAHILQSQLGNLPGFRISFSNPKKRGYIVSNNEQCDRQSIHLPILFLGFHPITSAIVQEPFLKSICERYGKIVDTYFSKSSLPQQRSNIMFTYENLESAMRAKYQLSKRRDLLKDKRVEVALILDEKALIKGRDMKSTEEKYGGTDRHNPKHNRPIPAFNPNPFLPATSTETCYSYPYPPPYSFHPYDFHPYNLPTSYMMNGYMNPSYFVQPQEQRPLEYDQNIPPQPTEMMEFLRSVVKNDNSKDQKLTEKLEKKESKPEPEWCGFLFRNKICKVGIDGYAKMSSVQFDQSLINISHLLKLTDYSLVNPAQMLAVESSDKLHEKAFEEYAITLKNRECIGVAVGYKYLMFIFPRGEQANKICPSLGSHQLLLVAHDIRTFYQLKDKLIKFQQDIVA